MGLIIKGPPSQGAPTIFPMSVTAVRHPGHAEVSSITAMSCDFVHIL